MVNSDDVGEEGERFNLSAHKIDKDLLVEILVLPLRHRRLQRDRVHDQRNELRHLLVDKLLVQLVHQDDDDGQLLQHLEAQHRLGDEVVGDVRGPVRHLLLRRDGRHRERLAQQGLNIQIGKIFDL